MQNARLDDSQAGIKTARRNIKNLLPGESQGWGRTESDTTEVT